MVDLGSLVLLTSIFAGKIAIAYVGIGLVLAIIGGFCMEKLDMEAYLTPLVQNVVSGTLLEQPTLTKKERILYAKEQLLATIKKVTPYIFVGVGL